MCLFTSYLLDLKIEPIFTNIFHQSICPNRKVLLPTGMKIPPIPDPGRESFFFAPIRRTRTFFNFRSLFFPNFLSQCHSHHKSHESIDSGTDSHYPMELMSYSHEWRDYTVNSFSGREWTKIFFFKHWFPFSYGINVLFPRMKGIHSKFLYRKGIDQFFFLPLFLWPNFWFFNLMYDLLI